MTDFLTMPCAANARSLLRSPLTVAGLMLAAVFCAGTAQAQTADGTITLDNAAFYTDKQG